MSDPFIQKIQSWRSESSGGVRKPFSKKAGKPLGHDPIMTNVLGKIRELIRGDELPSSIVLVGGAGNGKTDALEFIVSELDQRYECGGRLIEAVEDEFSSPGRTRTVDLTSWTSIPYDKVVLVQDASERDRDTDSAEESLLRDAGDFWGDRQILYLLCINRGKLEQAKRVAKREGVDSQELRVMSSIIAAIDPLSAVKQVSCWPLKGTSHYIWPMDVDSLFKGRSDGKDTVANQVLTRCVQYERDGDLELGVGSDLSLSLWNVSELNRAGRIDALVKFFSYVELENGFRFTFRDVLALVPHLVLPFRTEHEALIEGETEQLVSHIRNLQEAYYSKLFNAQPRFLGWDRLSREQLPQLQVFKAFLTAIFDHPRSQSSVARNLEKREFASLDPLYLKSEVQLTEDLTVRSVDRAFSSSVSQGVELCREYLTELDLRVLDALIGMEVGLTKLADSTPKLTVFIESCVQYVRRYCCLMVKRSLGVRRGVFGDEQYFSEYFNCLVAEAAAKRFVKRAFKSSVLHSGEKLRISFLANIGQDPAIIEDDVFMEVPVRGNEYEVRSINEEKGSIPSWDLIWLQIRGDVFVPVSFELFRSFKMIGENKLHRGVLSFEVLAGIDAIRGQLMGPEYRQLWALDTDGGMHLPKEGGITVNDSDNFSFSKL